MEINGKVLSINAVRQLVALLMAFDTLHGLVQSMDALTEPVKQKLQQELERRCDEECSRLGD